MDKIDFCSLANDHVRNLSPYQPGKSVEAIEREFGITDVIKLASNENPLGPSTYVLESVQTALKSAHLYPDGDCFELKQALSTFLQIECKQITVGNGSENILELIVKAYLHKGDTAVISQYAFLTIPLLIRSCGATAKIVNASDWGHDILAMIEAVDHHTRILFLINPNNPTGTYTNTHDFNLLMMSVPSHVLVVVDEAYVEYIHHPDYPDTLAFLNRHPNLVITRTFSKAYGLAALRLGYAISSPEIANMLNRSRLPFNVNTIAAKAACAALADQAHVKKSVALNHQGREQLIIGIEKLKLPYLPSLGNFITIDVQDALRCYHLLLQDGVIIRPLNAYNMPNHIRVTIGTAEQNHRFLIALEKTLV